MKRTTPNDREIREIVTMARYECGMDIDSDVAFEVGREILKTASKERTDRAISHITNARFCNLVNKWDALQPE